MPMNYMEWCEVVLRALGDAGEESSNFRNNGINEHWLALRIWGNEAERDRCLREADNKDVVIDALFDLWRIGLAEEVKYRWKLTRDGWRAVGDLFRVWESICEITLDEAEVAALKFVNVLSPVDAERFAHARRVSANSLTCELAYKTDKDFSREDGEELLAVLNEKRLVYGEQGDYMEDARATYAGLVWELRRAEVEGARLLDSLIAE